MSEEHMLLLCLLGVVLVVVGNVQLRRRGRTISQAAWFIAPGLLLMQSIMLRLVESGREPRGHWYDRAPEMILSLVVLCGVSMLSIVLLSRRGGARVETHTMFRVPALVGAGGIATLVLFEWLPLSALLVVVLGLGALYMARSEGDEEAHPLLFAASMLWAIMLGALSFEALWAEAGRLSHHLRYEWLTAEALREADAAFGRTIVATILTGLSGLLTLAACLMRSSAVLRRDRRARYGGVLVAAGCLGGGAMLLWSRLDAPERCCAERLREVIAEAGQPPRWTAGLARSGLSYAYVEWFEMQRCAVVPDGAGWRREPLHSSDDACGVQPVHRFLDHLLVSCERGPDDPPCREFYPLLVVPGERVAREVARSLAQSPFRSYIVALSPPAPTRHLRHLERLAWPIIPLLWEAGQDWWFPLRPYGVEGWNEHGRDGLDSMLVERGGRAQLLCDRQVVELGPDLSEWAAIVGRSSCPQAYSALGLVGIVPEARWTVQDVVDRCAPLAGGGGRCVVLDAPPAGLAEVLAKLDKDGR